MSTLSPIRGVQPARAVDMINAVAAGQLDVEDRIGTVGADQIGLTAVDHGDGVDHARGGDREPRGRGATATVAFLLLEFQARAAPGTERHQKFTPRARPRTSVPAIRSGPAPSRQ